MDWLARALRGLGIPALLLPAALLLGPLYLYPLAQVISSSLGTPWPSTVHYVELFSDPFVLRVFLQTLRLAGMIALLCVVVGYPVAYAMRIASDRTRRLMSVLIMLPLWTSILVRCFAWLVILGRNGLINEMLEALGIIGQPLKLVYNTTGVYVGMIHIMLPFMVFPLYNSLRRIDLRLVSAASSLGASPMAAFFWIVLPLSVPGVLAGALLVFMSSVGLFVIPALLGGLSDITYVMAIEKQVDELNNFELAAAMSVLLLAVTGLLTLLYERALSLDSSPGLVGRTLRQLFLRGPILALTWRARLIAVLLPAKEASPPAKAHSRASRHLLVKALAFAVIACLVVPLLVIFPLAFSGEAYLHFPPTSLSLRWFENYFSRDDWLTPTFTSVEVGVLATLGAILIGVPAAYAVVRGRFPGKGIVAAFLISPMIVPVMILAISLYALYARFKMIGTVGGLALAHTIIALPYVVVTVSAALRSADETLEAAALTLGAGRWRAFQRVTLPVLRPAILSAAFFAFVISFDDLVLALFLGGTNAKTLPLRMWEGIRFEIDPTIAAVSVLLIVVTVSLKLVGEWSKGRSDRVGIVDTVGRF